MEVDLFVAREWPWSTNRIAPSRLMMILLGVTVSWPLRPRAVNESGSS